MSIDTKSLKQKSRKQNVILYEQICVTIRARGGPIAFFPITQTDRLFWSEFRTRALP